MIKETHNSRVAKRESKREPVHHPSSPLTSTNAKSLVGTRLDAENASSGDKVVLPSITEHVLEDHGPPQKRSSSKLQDPGPRSLNSSP